MNHNTLHNLHHAGHKAAHNPKEPLALQAVGQGMAAGIGTSMLAGIFGATVGLPVLIGIGVVAGVAKLIEGKKH